MEISKFDSKLINELHTCAMNHAESAFFSERQGDIEKTKFEYFIAYLLEKQCADMLIKSTENVDKIEPTRSVICRSTAALAADLEKIGFYPEIAAERKKYYAERVISYNFSSDLVEEAQKLL